jgi:hypothetical protein
MHRALLLLFLAACGQTADPAQACLDAQAARGGAAHRLGCPSVRLDCPTGPVYVSDSVTCVAAMAGATSCADLETGPCDAYVQVSP